MKLFPVFLLAAAFFILVPPEEFAQELSLEEIAKQLNTDIKDSTVHILLNRIYDKVLKNPETLNFVLKQTYDKIKKNNFLKDLDIKFKTFQADTVSGLGLAYNYSGRIITYYIDSASASGSGLNISAAANGNISFIKRINPDNFLKTGAVINYFNSQGGAVAVTNEMSDSLTRIQMMLSYYNDIDSLNNSPLWKNYIELVSTYLTTQFFFDLSLRANLESSQDFSSKNYVYSGSIGIDIKAWDQNSAAARFNIFDWPFALIRYLSAADNAFSPSGAAIPTVLISADYVDPAGDRERKVFQRTEKYFRYGIEAGFKTLITEAAENRIFFSAGIRYYKEPGADEVIRNAGLDEPFYFSTALSLQSGMFISYSTGRLPYDLHSDDVYSIGFSYGF
jgi:predicted DNA-binding protein YlxM (UPF0122 family)